MEIWTEASEGRSLPKAWWESPQTAQGTTRPTQNMKEMQSAQVSSSTWLARVNLGIFFFSVSLIFFFWRYTFCIGVIHLAWPLEVLITAICKWPGTIILFALSLSLSGLQAQLDGEEQESEKTIGNAITQTQSKDNLNEYSTGDTLERVQKGNFMGARQKKQCLPWLR